MIKCKICGHEVKYRLIEHIIKTHKMGVDFYKENYGDVISIEYSEKCSKKQKEKWKENEYRKKTLKSKEWIYSDVELNERRIKSIKNYYKNGGRVWNKGLTKETDERIKNIGLFNKNNLTGRTKENYEYLNKHSIYMKERWDDSKIKEKWSLIQNDEKLKKDWSEKISKTISNKIINGELNTNSNYKSGWYENKIGKYWYSSSLELDAMKLFDQFNIKWSNNSIRITYKDLEGKERNYIPDFSIEINNKQIIIEMKGYDWDGLTKIKGEYCSKNYEYYIFYNIQELKKFIEEYEINKN